MLRLQPLADLRQDLAEPEVRSRPQSTAPVSPWTQQADEPLLQTWQWARLSGHSVGAWPRSLGTGYFHGHVCTRRPISQIPTSTARADVGRSAHLRARCDRAAMALAGCALGRSAPRSKGSTGARSRGAQRLAAKRHCWPSGRSGAGWRRSQGLPWVGGGLGGALRRQGRRSSFADFSAACPPSAASPRSLAWAEF